MATLCCTKPRSNTLDDAISHGIESPEVYNLNYRIEDPFKNQPAGFKQHENSPNIQLTDTLANTLFITAVE